MTRGDHNKHNEVRSENYLNANHDEIVIFGSDEIILELRDEMKATMTIVNTEINEM